jgi:hypothetical protein
MTASFARGSLKVPLEYLRLFDAIPAAEDFAATVCQIVSRHDPAFEPAGIKVVPSRNGRFQSVRLSIRATGESQLQALFLELKATGRVHMVV